MLSSTGNGPWTYVKTPIDVRGKQVTVSQENPEWGYIHKLIGDLQRKPWDTSKDVARLKNLDIGGDFYTERRSSGYFSPNVNLFRALTPQHKISYQGPLFAQQPSVAWNHPTLWPALASMTDEMNLTRAMGSTAIARTAPTVPVVSVANLLGELKNDGLPSLIGSVVYRAQGLKRKGKSLGDEYLNVEFGWKPLVSDILKISQAVVKAKELLLDYEKRSGENIRRNYSFQTATTTEIVDMGLATPLPTFHPSLYNVAKGQKTLEKVTTREYWFSGTYTYYVPSPDEARTKILRYADEAEKLLGLRVTPEVLWNLAPWSWFADWFFNIGSLATNVSAFQKSDLMLRRGYIMCKYTSRYTYTNTGINLFGLGPMAPLSQWFQSEVKMRRKASPWGFGVTFSGFTPKQIAIMAALGVTHV